MRGADVTQERLFSYVTPEAFVPHAHPLRPIREIVNAALREMDGTFAAMYAPGGRESIPPEQLLRGLLLQTLYGLRSERLLCEQLGYNLLYRWFVGLSLESAAWDHSTYSKNRDRLIEHQVIRELFERVLDRAREADLLLPTHAGPEIGVASTKAFTTQLAALALLHARAAERPRRGRQRDADQRLPDDRVAQHQQRRVVRPGARALGRRAEVHARHAARHRGRARPVAAVGARLAPHRQAERQRATGRQRAQGHAPPVVKTIH